MRRDNREKSNKGFTLVELIVVLVILAVLAAILTPALLGYIDEARSKRYFANAKTCFDAAQALFSQQYARNNETVLDTPVVSGTIFKNNKGNNDVTVNDEFRDEFLKLTGISNDSNVPYLFIVAVGSNVSRTNPVVSEVDKYTIYYAFYMENENAKPWYYYNGQWTTRNPRVTGESASTYFLDDYNYIKSGYDHAGLRLQYYFICNHKTTDLDSLWAWMRTMK